jgi:predicted Zn-dependent protease
MATFLRNLEHTERLVLGASRLPSFRATHPLTTSRVAEASSRAGMTAWKRGKPIAASRGEFLRRMEGLAIGARAEEGIFVGDEFYHADLNLMIRFPPGWTMKNTHRAVGAISPKRDAQISLEAQGPADDVVAAADKYMEELLDEGFKTERQQPLMIGAYPAFRIEGRIHGMGLVMTWILRDGLIFRFTGAGQGSAAARYRGAFLNVPRSFRSLQPHERERIRETRLRIVAARAGESLSELSKRSANHWDIQQTAVMNGLFTTSTLEAGQLVKVAVAERYDPKAAPTTME